MKTKIETISKPKITIREFEEAMARYAEAERREAAINKLIEAEVNEVLERFDDELRCLAQGKQAAYAIAKTYCTDNKTSLFERRRSIGTVDGIAGFRLSTPRLMTAKGFSWNQVLVSLKEQLPEYVRTTEEPAKGLLLNDRHKEHLISLLPGIGLKVVQEDLFYIEPRMAA